VEARPAKTPMGDDTGRIVAKLCDSFRKIGA